MSTTNPLTDDQKTFISTKVIPGAVDAGTNFQVVARHLDLDRALITWTTDRATIAETIFTLAQEKGCSFEKILEAYSLEKLESDES